MNNCQHVYGFAFVVAVLLAVLMWLLLSRLRYQTDRGMPPYVYTPASRPMIRLASLHRRCYSTKTSFEDEQFDCDDVRKHKISLSAAENVCIMRRWGWGVFTFI